MAHFAAVGIEDCYASGRLKVVVSVPVRLGASGEHCEVVGEGDACSDSVYPAFLFITVSESAFRFKVCPTVKSPCHKCHNPCLNNGVTC
jgi:hypothetical protein